MKKKKNKKNSGQALFEFVIFTPFFVAFFAIMIEISAAINGSINQQKAVRGFYYRSIRGNSTIPTNNNLDDLQGIQEIGAYSIGFQEKADGPTPIAPCYKISKLPGATYEDSCEEAGEDGEASGFFRVFTQYGTCTNSYTKSQNGGVFRYDYINRGFSSCNAR